MPNTCEDMGLTPDDLVQLTDSYRANMGALRNATLAAKRFSWQMLWTGGPATNIGSTKPAPLVRPSTCAADLRELCQADSPAQTRAMMYSLNGTRDASRIMKYPNLAKDLANFLLIRGPYAYLGNGWSGCSNYYPFPDEFNVDYGVPSGLCKETGSNTGVFVRDFSLSTVQMDCNTFTPTITMK